MRVVIVCGIFSERNGKRVAVRVPLLPWRWLFWGARRKTQPRTEKGVRYWPAEASQKVRECRGAVGSRFARWSVLWRGPLKRERRARGIKTAIFDGARARRHLAADNCGRVENTPVPSVAEKGVLRRGRQVFLSWGFGGVVFWVADHLKESVACAIFQNPSGVDVDLGKLHNISRGLRCPRLERAGRGK